MVADGSPGGVEDAAEAASAIPRLCSGAARHGRR